MPDALQEGTAAPTSVTASVPARPTRISPAHQPTTTPDNPSRATKQTAHQLAPPRSSSLHRRLTMANETGPTETRRRNREPGAATSAASREGTSSTAPGGIRPDAAQGQTGPPLAQPSPKRAREAPVAVGFSPTSVVGGDITRFIRAGVSPPNRLVFWGERAQGLS